MFLTHQIEPGKLLISAKIHISSRSGGFGYVTKNKNHYII